MHAEHKSGAHCVDVVQLGSFTRCVYIYFSITKDQADRRRIFPEKMRERAKYGVQTKFK